ncbi:coatomer subunit beta [Malassezia sp. CBS 17886]|nr:coatomer subunit beta [Malassezia sp. CBS 17886]
MPSDPSAYTLVASDARYRLDLTTQELRRSLQSSKDDVKLETLRAIIVSTLNGEPHPSLLMPIIQYVLPSKNKQIKKMLHFYWEVCPKLDAEGTLKQEMILVCNAIRNDLQHPNEYIRGSTLRFLQKIKEPEILEPLIATVRQCLEYRHSYVRKNAVFALLTIYQRHEHLVSDAPELMEAFLATETDATCKRNAFLMLVQTAPERAVAYFSGVLPQVGSFDELMQMAIIELIRRESRGESEQREEYTEVVSELLASPSHAVKYEAAVTLAGLAHNAAAVRAVASALIELTVAESDNNVKLIVLDRLDALRHRHEHVLDPLVLDLLRILSSPDMDVRKKVLAMSFDMLSVRSVEEVILLLKKELVKTSAPMQDNSLEYRQLLIKTLHACAVRFSEVAGDVMHELMDFLGDTNNPSAVEVIAFVREVVEKFPSMRGDILRKLIASFPSFRSGKVYRGALWIVGDYCTTIDSVNDAMQQIRKVLGPVPILAAEERQQELAEAGAAEADAPAPAPRAATTTRVRADGTYATESAFTADVDTVPAKASKPPLRSLILYGDFYTASVLAATLVKLVLRFFSLSSDAGAKNALRAEAMLIMTSILRVGHSKFASTTIDEDSEERILTCLQVLGQAAVDPDTAAETAAVFLSDTRDAYAHMLERDQRKAAEDGTEKRRVAAQPDAQLYFRQLGGAREDDDSIDYEAELSRATGVAATARDDFISKLQRVVQLTGFSDPVYAEAYVDVHQFDILLDILVVNQTGETMQNLSVELATLGDLKLVERPSSYVLAPYNYQSIKATIKVSSTETGVIFGNIVYDCAAAPGSASAGDSRYVVLNDIHVDIMDYISPAQCTETQFRSMWTGFEWENKVNVKTDISNVREYLDHIMKSTNMACLTPEASLAGECGFLSANLCARSLFGEDALANVSIERLDDGTIQGHVRIRSKTQGIALSLGDKITLERRFDDDGRGLDSLFVPDIHCAAACFSYVHGVTMKFGKSYAELLSHPTFPEEWRQGAIEYNQVGGGMPRDKTLTLLQLKKLLHGVVDELQSLGLSADVLGDLLTSNDPFVLSGGAPQHDLRGSLHAPAPAAVALESSVRCTPRDILRVPSSYSPLSGSSGARPAPSPAADWISSLPHDRRYSQDRSRHRQRNRSLSSSSNLVLEGSLTSPDTFVLQSSQSRNIVASPTPRRDRSPTLHQAHSSPSLATEALPPIMLPRDVPDAASVSAGSAQPATAGGTQGGMDWRALRVPVVIPDHASVYSMDSVNTEAVNEGPAQHWVRGEDGRRAWAEYQFVKDVDAAIHPQIVLHVESPDSFGYSPPQPSSAERKMRRGSEASTPTASRRGSPSTSFSSSPLRHMSLKELELGPAATDSTLPGASSECRDASSHSAQNVEGYHTRRVVIPLAAEERFFKTLSNAICKLLELHVMQQKILVQHVNALCATITQVASPQYTPTDMYAWREIFALWIEQEVFESSREKDRGEISVAETESRLRNYMLELEKRGYLSPIDAPTEEANLASKLDSWAVQAFRQRNPLNDPRSIGALEHFLRLNVALVSLKRFQRLNLETVRKILKKHEKRTALQANAALGRMLAMEAGGALVRSASGQPTFTQLNLDQASQGDILRALAALIPVSLNAACQLSLPRILSATLTEALLPIVPTVDDYSCMICTAIAWQPIRLVCDHVFCIRCLVKLQKQGDDHCPLCRTENAVRDADESNMDLDMAEYLRQWFPHEIAAKTLENKSDRMVEERREVELRRKSRWQRLRRGNRGDSQQDCVIA